VETVGAPAGWPETYHPRMVAIRPWHIAVLGCAAVMCLLVVSGVVALVVWLSRRNRRG
jgi:hypothetical protein